MTPLGPLSWPPHMGAVGQNVEKEDISVRLSRKYIEKNVQRSFGSIHKSYSQIQSWDVNFDSFFKYLLKQEMKNFPKSSTSGIYKY